MGFRWLVPKCAEFDREDIEKIVDASIRILREVPWTIDGTVEFMEYLRNFGFQIEGNKVRFTPEVIEKTLARIKEEKQKNLSRGGDKYPVAPQEIRYAASGQALWAHDIEKDTIRPATKDDLADFSRVVNTYPGLDRTHPTFIPTDAPLKTRELHAYITIMLNSDKPYRVSCYSPEILDYFVEANTIYYGSREEGIKKLLLPCKVWINTPFMISRDGIEAAMKLRALTGRTLDYTAMPVCGVATPVTYDGALTLITAEVIGVNAIGLAVDSVLPRWMTGIMGFDMKGGIFREWSPQTLILNTAGAQISSYLFGTSPFGMSTGNLFYTSAKKPGLQSAMEKAFGMAIVFASGGRNFGALGTLADGDVGSILQLVIDMELISAIKEFVKGFDISDETIGEDLIKEISVRGAYFLDSMHTFQYYRRYGWISELMDTQFPSAWINNPKEMLDNAREKARELIKNAPNRCPLDENKKKELLNLLKIADEKLGER
ncbi:MAG: trimethylamine methyltransferase family protein [bacterium]|nr:trimethylamine methyltransferase family protein [bacterium]